MESIKDILFSIGFSNEDIEKYLKLSDIEKEKMLINYRKNILDKVHQDEKKIDAIDYIRYKLRNKM